MRSFYFVLFFLLILAQSISHEPWQREGFYVWNIGQGQWITFVQKNTCEHYDTGGEKAPWKKIINLCENRKNIVFLSHWDWDHISFIGRLEKKVKDICLVEAPDGPTSQHKKNLIQKVQICRDDLSKSAVVLDRGRNTRSNNDRSNVVISKGFLIPGDSTIRQELYWSKKLLKRPIENLILGHHGSRTSTSDQLLNVIPNLKHAISSSRRKKYGHPHQQVVAKLSIRKIPLLLTEEWGDIYFQ